MSLSRAQNMPANINSIVILQFSQLNSLSTEDKTCNVKLFIPSVRNFFYLVLLCKRWTSFIWGWTNLKKWRLAKSWKTVVLLPCKPRKNTHKHNNLKQTTKSSKKDLFSRIWTTNLLTSREKSGQIINLNREIS